MNHGHYDNDDDDDDDDDNYDDDDHDDDDDNVDRQGPCPVWKVQNPFLHDLRFSQVPPLPSSSSPTTTSSPSSLHCAQEK